jgi:hypothetical protein
MLFPFLELSEANCFPTYRLMLTQFPARSDRPLTTATNQCHCCKAECHYHKVADDCQISDGRPYIKRDWIRPLGSFSFQFRYFFKFTSELCVCKKQHWAQCYTTTIYTTWYLKILQTTPDFDDSHGRHEHGRWMVSIDPQRPRCSPDNSLV